MRWLVFLSGLYIVIEAILSLFWSKNDKWIGSQLVRGTRVVVGLFLMVTSYFINPSEKTLHFNARDESVFYFSPKLCYTKYIVVRTDSVEVEETIHWSTTKLFNNLDRWLQK